VAQWKRVGYLTKLVCYLVEYEPYLGIWSYRSKVICNVILSEEDSLGLSRTCHGKDLR